MKIDLELIKEQEGYNVLKNIWRPNFAEAAVKILEEHGTEEKLEEAQRVAHAVEALLVDRNMLLEEQMPKFVDVLRVAALLHNVFYDKNDVTTLFKVRSILLDEYTDILDQETIDAVSQSVEAQDWYQSIVPMTKPAPSSPAEILAIAKWVTTYKSFN